MNPVAFSLGSLEIRWYGVIITCGVLLATAIVYMNAKKKNLDVDLMIDAFLWAFPVALITARAYYVLFELDNYDTIWEMINIRSGGIAIHGGLIGAFLAIYVFAKVKKKNFFEYMDVVVPGIILAQAVGRWGNFMNQEAHGGPVSESFISKFPEFIKNGMLIDGVYYHPTFLYESICNILFCVVLMFILYKIKTRNQHGIVFGSYLILYSVGRFFIEGLRTDSLMFFGLRIAQIMSLAWIALGTIIIVWAVKKAKKLNS